MVKLFAHALRPSYSKPDMEKVESEIDRLFKTNVFNVSYRTIERNSLLKKHPAMANFTAKEYKFDDTNEN